MDPTQPPAPTTYPFPEDTSFAEHIAARERSVCGGFTMIALNQPHQDSPAFICSHGDTAGCAWRLPFSYPTSPHAVAVFEIDYADQLHREHAWRRLEERSGPTPA